MPEGIEGLMTKTGKRRLALAGVLAALVFVVVLNVLRATRGDGATPEDVAAQERVLESMGAGEAVAEPPGEAAVRPEGAPAGKPRSVR